MKRWLVKAIAFLFSCTNITQNYQSFCTFVWIRTQLHFQLLAIISESRRYYFQKSNV